MPETVESSIATYEDAIMDLGDLNPAHYNPRKDLRPGDPQYESIKASILDFGYKDPMVWNRRTGRLVGGHQRLKILRELGFARAKVVVVDVDETTEIRLNIALNNATGENDEVKLLELLQRLKGNDKDLDLRCMGFDDARLKELADRFALPSFEPEFDEGIEDEVRMVTCPRCGHEFPL